MSTRYAISTSMSLLVLCSLLCLVVVPARAQDAPTAAAQALDRARTLRTLSLLRNASGPDDHTAGASGAITGRLDGLDADALASAAVLAWTADSLQGGIGMGVLMPDGSYRIDGLAPGDYYVMAMARDYVPVYYDAVTDLARATTVAVADGATVTGIDFTLERIAPGTGRITGTVRSDASRQPIAGAVVYTFSPENPFFYARTQTAADGTYVLSGLKTGRYVVEVWAEGFLPEYFDDAASFEQASRVNVSEPGETAGIDFGLAEGATISGYVRTDDGKPIAGAYLMATTSARGDTAAWRGPGGSSTGWAVSGPDGAYRIGGLAAGTYFVMAQASTQWTYATEWYDGAAAFEGATPIDVAAGESVTGIDFSLALPVATGAIEGRVTDGEGRPVAHAFVTAQDAFPPSRDSVRSVVWASTLTGPDGSYRIEGLPAGRFLVSAAVQSGWEYVQRWYPDARTMEEATPVAVAEDERVAGIDLSLPRRAGDAAIAGVVRDASGRALPWAFVDVTLVEGSSGADRAAFWAYAQADSVGAYRIDRLPEGDYLVHASHYEADRFGQAWFDGAASPDAAVPVAVAAGEVREGIDFMLTMRPIYGIVNGTVTDAATGAPIARAYVELSPVGRDYAIDAPFRYVAPHAVTDAAGRFELTHLPQGTYVLTVYANGAFGRYVDPDTDALVTPFEVVGGETTTRNVALRQRYDGDGVISGTVTMQTDGPDSLWVDPVWPRAGASSAGLVDARTWGPDVAVVVALPAGEGMSDVRHVAVTEPGGSYVLNGLASGPYLVRSFASGYIGAYHDGVYSPDEATVVYVDGRQPTAGIDFTLVPAYYYAYDESGVSPLSVYGRVTEPAGKPVAEALVYLLDEAERPVANAQAGADGSFQLSGVLPGRYRVYASKPGYAASYNGAARAFAEAEPITLAGGYVEVNLVLEPATATGVEDDPAVPHALVLQPNYPNPFNPSTHIAFTVPGAGQATLRVYDVLGREVAMLFDGPAEPGRRYEVTFQADGLATGVYLYALDFGGRRVAQTMMLAK